MPKFGGHLGEGKQMNEQERELVRFLRILERCECLPHVVLVGSWAQLVWERAGLLQGFEPDIRTMDMDFLVRNLRRPPEPARLTTAAREEGYYIASDRITGATKIFAREGLEVEFLIAKVGAGVEDVLKTNVGVTAQSLRHLDMLARWAIPLSYEGMEVFVPSPEAWTAHKMAINPKRGVKREKDARAVVNLWPHLSKDRFGEVVQGMSKRERSTVNQFIMKYGLA